MSKTTLFLGGLMVSLASTTLAQSSLPACGTIPSDADTYECECGADAPRRSVWGSGPYTADSDICTAALHAGAIDMSGGPVSVISLGGLESYAGTDQNGVSTSNWGSYGASIVINMNAQ